MSLESQYQAGLVKKLRKMFPTAVVLKNDPTYLQGVPDLLILFKDRWAMLEVKRSPDAPYEPNQEHYLSQLGAMSYASVINPVNEEEVLNELQHALRATREARVSKR